MYTTRYGENIARILAAYPPGLLQVKALEILIQTAQQHARDSAQDDVAQQVCEGLHITPATGLKCRACYNVEKNLPMQQMVESDILAATAAEVKAGRALAEPRWDPQPESLVYSADPLPED